MDYAWYGAGKIRFGWKGPMMERSSTPMSSFTTTN